MRYYQLTDDVSIPKRWHLGVVSTADGSEPRLRVGVPFRGGQLTATVFRPGVALVFSLSSFGVPVLTAHLAEAIERVAGVDVQRLPVTIGGQLGHEVLNVVRVVECLDQEQSVYLKWTDRDHRPDLAGQFRMVTRLRLNPRAIPHDAHVFRVEGWLIAMVVSEAVKEAMEAVGCVGARFSEVA